MNEALPDDVGAHGEAGRQLPLHTDTAMDGIRRGQGGVGQILTLLGEIDVAHGKVPVAGIERPEEFVANTGQDREQLRARERGGLWKVQRPATVKNAETGDGQTAIPQRREVITLEGQIYGVGAPGRIVVAARTAAHHRFAIAGCYPRKAHRRREVPGLNRRPFKPCGPRIGISNAGLVRSWLRAFGS